MTILFDDILPKMDASDYDDMIYVLNWKITGRLMPRAVQCQQGRSLFLFPAVSISRIELLLDLLIVDSCPCLKIIDAPKLSKPAHRHSELQLAHVIRLVMTTNQ